MPSRFLLPACSLGHASTILGARSLIRQLRERIVATLERQARCWNEQILPGLIAARCFSDSAMTFQQGSIATTRSNWIINGNGTCRYICRYANSTTGVWPSKSRRTAQGDRVRSQDLPAVNNTCTDGSKNLMKQSQIGIVPKAASVMFYH
jgi:hypothetical protein